MMTKRRIVFFGLASATLFFSAITGARADETNTGHAVGDKQAAQVADAPKASFTAQPLANQLSDDQQAMEDVADALGDKIPARPGIEQLQIERLGSAVLNQRNAK